MDVEDKIFAASTSDEADAMILLSADSRQCSELGSETPINENTSPLLHVNEHEENNLLAVNPSYRSIESPVAQTQLSRCQCVIRFVSLHWRAHLFVFLATLIDTCRKVGSYGYLSMKDPARRLRTSFAGLCTAFIAIGWAFLFAALILILVRSFGLKKQCAYNLVQASPVMRHLQREGSHARDFERTVADIYATAAQWALATIFIFDLWALVNPACLLVFVVLYVKVKQYRSRLESPIVWLVFLYWIAGTIYSICRVIFARECWWSYPLGHAWFCEAGFFYYLPWPILGIAGLLISALFCVALFSWLWTTLQINQVLEGLMSTRTWFLRLQLNQILRELTSTIRTWFVALQMNQGLTSTVRTWLVQLRINQIVEETIDTMRTWFARNMNSVPSQDGNTA